MLSTSETIMTQSLGNMVACEALRQGLHVGKYFMFDRDMSQDDQWLALAKYVPAVSHPVYGTRRYTPRETYEITDGSLMSRPFFRDFRDEEMYGEGGSEFVRTNDFARWYALSHGIPAESFAAGANPVPKWEVMEDDDGDSKASSQSNSALARNINMATACNPEGEEADPVNWIHSYFIQRSLHDTKMLYEKMTKIINGNPIGDK